MTIPLEDNFEDIIGKAQRGFGLDDDHLARKAGVTVSDLGRVKSGQVLEEVLRKVARTLELGEQTLVDSANKAWYPNAQKVEGLAAFTTPYQGMTVNAYLVWNLDGRPAVVFDTGASASEMLKIIQEKNLSVTHVLLTHTHGDHIADLKRLKQETGAGVYVSEREPVPGAESFGEGTTFTVGGLQIATRLTSGHSKGGITYVITGLSKRVAVVGDALFAGSMGGGLVSYVEALGSNRKHILSLPDDTVVCPGHGPMSTVGEEKQHNPFFPEFQS
jgi:glyoxylase-like metal-dependent hydrolase (beta-lactamase superfamily II)